LYSLSAYGARTIFQYFSELVQLKLNIEASDTIVSSGEYCRRRKASNECFAPKDGLYPTWSLRRDLPHL